MKKRRNPTVQDFEDELRKQPVGYWDNGTVRHPVNFSSLIRECERLHKIAQMIQCPKCGYKPETSVDDED